MTNTQRMKSDMTTKDKRDVADRATVDSRNKNDLSTQERRFEADATLKKNRERNDEITADRREKNDGSRDMALAMSLVLIVLIIATFFIFI
ncbi:MAG: hypothetical protein Q8P15_03575 [Nanoarchaeota archaeon]|nr:hypothetical protein [Nanoarchaeota archaeon]